MDVDYWVHILKITKSNKIRIVDYFFYLKFEDIKKYYSLSHTHIRTLQHFDLLSMVPDKLFFWLEMFSFVQSINGVDFRKSIFIFLSNTGGRLLTEKTLEAWRDRSREEITSQELEELVQVII